MVLLSTLLDLTLLHFLDVNHVHGLALCEGVGFLVGRFLHLQDGGFLLGEVGAVHGLAGHHGVPSGAHRGVTSMI